MKKIENFEVDPSVIVCDKYYLQILKTSCGDRILHNNTHLLCNNENLFYKLLTYFIQ